MNKVCFVVDEKPFCIWVPDPNERNIEILQEVDPTYFEYLASVHQERLNSNDKMAAALSLRTAYSHGLETLMAFLCSTVQSPHCVYGWLGLYTLDDLRSVVKKVSQGQNLYTVFEKKSITWDYLSRVIHTNISPNEDIKQNEIIKSYANLWNRFSSDFLDENYRQEYNCIKHGFRVKSGGFQVSFNNIDFGGSEFGSRFFAREKIKDKNKYHFRIRRKGVNWSPAKLIERLYFISYSLLNVISYLRALNGDDTSQLKMWYPNDLSAFASPWCDEIRAKSIGIDYLLNDKDIILLPKEEILSEYDKNYLMT